jgi:hypothetical protein
MTRDRFKADRAGQAKRGGERRWKVIGKRAVNRAHSHDRRGHGESGRREIKAVGPGQVCLDLPIQDEPDRLTSTRTEGLTGGQEPRS